jgi:hypothetical protein
MFHALLGGYFGFSVKSRFTNDVLTSDRCQGGLTVETTEWEDLR